MRSASTVFLAFVAMAATASAQNPPTGLQCSVTANPPLVHAEGVAERLGDIVFACRGGAPGGIVPANLGLFLNTAVTNKVSADGSLDVALIVNTGAGDSLVPARAALGGSNLVLFSGGSFTLSESGTANLRIANLRGDVTAVSDGPFRSVQAMIASTGPAPFVLDRSSVQIGVPVYSLYATYLTGTLSCSNRVAAPDTATLASLLQSGVSYSSTRLAEGFASAFEPRQPLADNGVRLVARYTGFPEGSRLFVPDAVAGSTADVPTSAGGFGGAISAGRYSAGRPSLLLVRVLDADENGAGGTLIYEPPANAAGVDLDSWTAVEVENGAATVVYEVVDAHPSVAETAQMPVFLAVGPGQLDPDLEPKVEYLLGPVSTTNTVSSTAPVPRFTGAAIAQNCTPAECDPAYFPKLDVRLTEPLRFNLRQGTNRAVFILIHNLSAPGLAWNLSVEYKDGSGWTRVLPAAGVDNYTASIEAFAGNLAPGTYEATLVVDAGVGGRQTFPIELQVTPGTPSTGIPAPETPAQPQAIRPSIERALSAATLEEGVFVRGSRAVIRGGFKGSERTVAVDGIPATVLRYDNHNIEFLVPAGIAANGTSLVVVTVDGTASDPFPLRIAEAAPEILPASLRNENYHFNTAENPAVAGSLLRIFTTGLVPPEGGTVEVKIGDRVLAETVYAGAHDGLPGIQRVDVMVPQDLPSQTTEVLVCTTTAGGRACSAPVPVSIRKQ